MQKALVMEYLATDKIIDILTDQTLTRKNTKQDDVVSEYNSLTDSTSFTIIRYNITYPKHIGTA